MRGHKKEKRSRGKEKQMRKDNVMVEKGKHGG